MQLVKSVWFYLAGTLGQGLIFQNAKGEKQLNVFTEASYSDVSFGCHLILWGFSLLLWKAGKQPIQAASTAESELVEVLEGALAGDAVKVVMEEALDVCRRSFSYTDSSAALSIIAGETGSWRTQHLRKRAFISRAKVLSGEWMIRHVRGAEMPADLGTKVLSVQKFNQHKEAMGMFLGIDEKEKERNQIEAPSGMSKEIREAALKIIILVTKLSLAGAHQAAEKEPASALIISDASSALQMRSVSNFHVILFVAVILFVGILIGACIMGVFMWHRLDKLTVVNFKGSMMNGPAFLYPLTEREKEEKDRRQRGQPARSSTARERSSGARPAGPAAGSTAAGRAAAAGGDRRGAGQSEAAAGLRAELGDLSPKADPNPCTPLLLEESIMGPPNVTVLGMQVKFV